MCRHLGYLGSPLSLAATLFDPPWSLQVQSYAPRRQRHGTVNADGFGAGWYLPGRVEPVRYRRAQPIWSDASFASLAPTVQSGCILAAVRCATQGTPPDESCAAPFTHRQWLFSHNGRLADYPRTRKILRDEVADVPDAFAGVDSAFCFGLAVARWEAGANLAQGLAMVVSDIAGAGGGRLNLLATDGRRLAATTFGDTLFVRTGVGSVILASEPLDDEPDWTAVPPNSVVDAGADDVSVTALTVEYS